MPGTPLQITLYDGETGEVKQTYTRMFVSWRLLKAAVQLSKQMQSTTELSGEEVDALAGLVCEVFGNKFSIEDLNDGADISEMMTVITQIVAKARGAVPNALPPVNP